MAGVRVLLEYPSSRLTGFFPPMSVSALTRAERRIAYAMAGIFGTRMLGLFLIVPVFVEYSRNLQGYTPALAGLAIGIYGLAQALLRLPRVRWWRPCPIP